MPRVTVIGTGYLGLTHAVRLADLWHEVLAIDVDVVGGSAGAGLDHLVPDTGLYPRCHNTRDSTVDALVRFCLRRTWRSC